MKTTLNLCRRVLISNCHWALRFASLSLLVGVIHTTNAATLTVTTLDDSGSGSLRQAIADAAPGDSIDFAVTGTITLTSGELVVTNDLTITGPGATNLTVSGNNQRRVFSFSNVTAAINGLSIAKGYVAGQSGAGILSQQSTLLVANCTLVGNGAYFVGGFGGGIAINQGTTTIIDTTICSNSITEWGGGVYSSSGTLNLVNCAIFANTAGSYGGGIYSGGILNLTNSTVSGNGCSAGGGGLAGRIDYIVSSTICSNRASQGADGGGGICSLLTTTTPSIWNSVVAGNSVGMPNRAQDITSFDSLDYNLIGDTNGATITGVTTHNIYGVDSLLGPLADNGGPTMTHALLPGSPAIDRGSSGGLATDQRGLPRPCNFASTLDAGDASDIGAFELQGSSVTTLADSGPGSLRQAIADAAPGDTIDFAVTGTITLTSGELVITNNLTISGPGVTNLTVSGNNASRVIYVGPGTVLLSGLTIANGRSDSGGGVCNIGGSLTISNSAIIGNTASGTGGGLYSIWGNIVVQNTQISSNSASYGGGISSEDPIVIVDSTISANQAVSTGAGAAMVRQQSVSMTNVTISGNSGAGWAGVLAIYGGNLVSSTIVSNTGLGVGIMSPGFTPGSLNVRSTIIAGNSSGDYSGNLNSLDFNLIGNTNGATITGVTTHNIYGVDPLLGPLADNGGPTPTHALLPGSPAIDQGSSGGLTTDQRGLPRLVDFSGIANASDGDGSDIGAYELQDLPQTGPVFTVNTTQDSNDGVAGIFHCSLREAIAKAAPGDIIDFAVTGTITLTSGELVITNDLTITGPGPTNLTVSGNNASRVFFLNNVTAAISGLTVSNGRISEADRGAIQNAGGSLTISNCAVSGNVSDAFYNIGSGISNEGELTVVNSIISNNSGGYCTGAGVSSGSSARALKLINCTVAGNSGESAAGVFIYGGSCLITNTTVSGNVAWGSGSWFTSYGAGISLVRGGPFWLCNSTVTANSNVVNNTIAGGIFVTRDTLHLFSSIVAGNGGTVSYPDLGGWGSLSSLDYNLIGDTNGAAITGVTTHNIYGVDPLLGPLADNGGPTLTHALLPGSPAIDHGSSGGLATDQRGLARPFNFPAYFDADDACDIGAVEMHEGPQTGPVFTVNTTDDVDDGLPGIAHCSLREAIAAANASADTNTIDFAAEVPGVLSGVTGTITLTNGQLTITDSVNIVGPGAANLTVSGNNASRVFNIFNIASASATASISGLAIANGINGIVNRGKLTVFNSTISDCGTGLGNAGIYNSFGGALKLINSTLCRNYEGGVMNYGTSCMITNTTFSGNSAGVQAPNTEVWLWNSTVCSNGQGIAIWQSGIVHVRSSLVAANGRDSGGAGWLVSEDYNLIGNTNGANISGVTTHNIYNQDPKLGPLADLGGPTPTHALRFDSPALDAGHSGGLTTDQRGLPRPIDDPNTPNAEGGDGSDIGAYEADPNLRITGIGKTGGDIWLNFNSIWGRSYAVEATDELPTVTWNVLTNNVAGTGGRFQAIDVGGATAPKRFYRAVLLP